MSGDPDFFHSRGIPDEIWQARPYVWWTPEDPEPATSRFADLTPPQRAFVAKIAHQAPGWVIVRRPPPMFPPLPPVYPELRPMSPVRTQGPRTHWHGDGMTPDDLAPWQKVPGTRSNWQKHIDRAKAADDHRGVNVETVHSHQAYAKYVFASSERVEVWYQHDHNSGWKRTSAVERPSKRHAHVAKTGTHSGTDVAGPHFHPWRVKGQDAMARRVDVHPDAVRKLIEDPVAFFVLEGCVKSDAVLAAGGAVFSVPSVSLWDADELERFVADYLCDKVVVIVPDADWSLNPLVINQARMAEVHLYRLGVAEIRVAAPPLSYFGISTKGVDDFIGAGGHLEDLLVIDNEPPAGLHEYVAKNGFRSDRALRDAKVIRALSTYTGPAGIFAAPLSTLARVMGVNRMAVSRAVKDLEQLGAVTVDGDLATATGWFSHRLDWRERPSITLAAELRSVHRPEQRLGDLVDLATTERSRLAG